MEASQTGKTAASVAAVANAKGVKHSFDRRKKYFDCMGVGQERCTVARVVRIVS